MIWRLGGWLSAISCVIGCGGRADSPPEPGEPLPSFGGSKSNGSGGSASGGAAGASTTGGTLLTIPIGTQATLAETCGNGQVDPNEQCDDANRLATDGCSRLCQVELGFECPSPGQACVRLYPCGNAKVDGAEVCDDGNQASGDGCDAMCSAVEPGWQCRVPGAACAPICGDYVTVGDDYCDHGLTNGVYVPGAAAGCSLGCTLVANCELTGFSEPCSWETRCGDGQINGLEQCDAGPFNDDASYGGCNTRCGFGPYCGDGVVNGDEACDPGQTPVAVYGEAGCTAACQLSHYCGDGVVDDFFGEECDGGQACGGWDCLIFLGP